MADSDEESKGLDPMNLEEKLWHDIADLEEPVFELFADNDKEREAIWNMLLGKGGTSEVLSLSDDYRRCRDREFQLDFEMNKLIDPETHELGTEFESVFALLKEEWHSLQLLKKSNEVHLQDALRKLAAAQALMSKTLWLLRMKLSKILHTVMTVGAAVDSKAYITGSL